ncbi:hypothetical protein [Paenibacillus abyssi]|uniref:Type IV secretion system protein VirB6 n=1 Tax=Paenibacillus abyssi TaxID=1340531 RepID=A0A917CI18_9BACL|nr:hypothetical protein [Paenibacillus abyssi]GGF89194.1 hypothetical protein GCM10010916_03140 [Paenibacillus abyssi]
MRIKKLTAFMLIAVMIGLNALPGISSAAESTLKPVQVFDVAQGKVVKSFDNDAEFQGFAESWLKSVTGLAPQLKPDDKCGYVYRIPLTKPAMIKTGNLSLHVEDVFLFYCAGKPPILLVFDTEKRPYLLNFKADLQPFLNKVGYSAQ